MRLHVSLVRDTLIERKEKRRNEGKVVPDGRKKENRKKKNVTAYGTVFF